MVTDNYILMCDQAKQLQNAWEPKDWDIFVYRDSEEMDIMMYMEEEYNRKEMWIVDGIYIWLPTQEQLQEMMPKSDVTSLVEYIKNVELRYHDRFDENAVGYFTGTFISLTELWLAFVVKERWNKIWTGEKWEAVK